METRIRKQINTVTLQYDERKNVISKHHISIPELATIFDDPNVILDVVDEKHSQFEERYYARGWTSLGFYVLVWYTYRGEDTIRIIGGRKLH